MAAILNICHLGFSHLSFPLRLLTLAKIGSHYLHKKTSLVHSDSTWWWQPSWILPCWIHLVFPLPLQLGFICKKNFTHSFWLNLMMAAILNSAIFDSAIYSKTSLIHSHSTWWWQPSWTLPSWIQPFNTKKTSLLVHSGSSWWWQWYLEFCHFGFSHFAQKKTSLIHSDSTWWWQPSWILPCWIQTLILDSDTTCYLLQILKNISATLTLIQIKIFTHSFWLNLMMAVILNSAILDSAILYKKKPSLIHSDSTWWWQPSWILPCLIWPAWIQPF